MAPQNPPRRSVVDIRPWRARLEEWLDDGARPTQPFIDANRAAISRCFAHEESGLRFVVNIPADALLGFLDAQRYMNAYNLPIVAGHARGPSAVRERVDRLLGFSDPQNYFYGAASLGGIHVRAGQPTEGVCGVLV
jgi:hypothetical protein